jgi:hypothetical protein|tara:strand:- start:50 stop:823 length:774 start_codon:yes stop_codon:yes gene_type:complete
MNIKDTCYVTVIILLIMAGCASPLGKFNKQQKVVDNIKTEVDVNKEKQVESGRTFVYAADQSLQKDPQPSQHSQVAKQMTTRSLTALGPPQMANAVKSDQMINKLLSHDPRVVEEGQAELMTMDKQLIAFQNQNRLLNSQLGAANQKLRAVNEDNAIQATKYASLMGKVYWIVGIVIFLTVFAVGIKIVGAVAPFAMPATGASSTLLKVVQGIQKVRDQHMGEKPEMLKQIDDHMRSHLDKKDRWMIAQAKQKLHMI